MDKRSKPQSSKPMMLAAAAATLLAMQLGEPASAEFAPPDPAAMLTLDLQLDLGLAAAALRLDL